MIEHVAKVRGTLVSSGELRVHEREWRADHDGRHAVHDQGERIALDPRALAGAARPVERARRARAAACRRPPPRRPLLGGDLTIEARGSGGGSAVDDASLEAVVAILLAAEQLIVRRAPLPRVTPH